MNGLTKPAGGPTQLTYPQNRELQIMRIVRHPNIVELKAFYYSNGERVRHDFLNALIYFAKAAFEALQRRES